MGVLPEKLRLQKFIQQVEKEHRWHLVTGSIDGTAILPVGVERAKREVLVLLEVGEPPAAVVAPKRGGVLPRQALRDFT